MPSGFFWISITMNETHRTFLGHSGTPYNLTRHSLQGPFPTTGGICIYAYRHPRGHLAGFRVHILAIRQADDLHASITATDKTCVMHECCNSIYTLEWEDAKTREAIVKDLESSHPTPC